MTGSNGSFTRSIWAWSRFVVNSDLLEETVYASETNESGALTISFTSDGSVTYPGWAAEIGCTTYGPCFGFDVDVMTT